MVGTMVGSKQNVFITVREGTGERWETGGKKSGPMTDGNGVFPRGEWTLGGGWWVFTTGLKRVLGVWGPFTGGRKWPNYLGK